MRSLVLLFFCLVAFSKEFKKPEQALMEAYKGAQVQVRNIVLKPEQAQEVQRLSGVKMDTRLSSWYIVVKEGRVIAYAYVDTHIVRTHPEAVLYSIKPDGSIDFIEVLAFGEPLEYMPEERWLSLFAGKSLEKDPIRLRRDIPNMTGATLTARAITDNTRKVLALWKVLFGEKR
ncbi:MAG: FMN-binding protein [Aquificota bacterium]|nr:MAG: FMN-binding protein [Aquificota bacterium]